MIKGADGKWQEASWADALQAVAQGLSRVRDSFGAGRSARWPPVRHA